MIPTADDVHTLLDLQRYAAALRAQVDQTEAVVDGFWPHFDALYRRLALADPIGPHVGEGDLMLLVAALQLVHFTRQLRDVDARLHECSHLLN